MNEDTDGVYFARHLNMFCKKCGRNLKIKPDGEKNGTPHYKVYCIECAKKNHIFYEWSTCAVWNNIKERFEMDFSDEGEALYWIRLQMRHGMKRSNFEIIKRERK